MIECEEAGEFLEGGAFWWFNGCDCYREEKKDNSNNLQFYTQLHAYRRNGWWGNKMPKNAALLCVLHCYIGFAA